MIFELLNNLITPTEILVLLAALVIAITVHEASHAALAWYLGDPTAKLQGRLTLNPLAHLDPLGTLMILFVHFGWGKPVPFDPFNLKNPKRDGALISLAGPAANFLTALIFTIPIWVGVLAKNPEIFEIGKLLIPIIFLNLTLGIFNLIPVHPLDGFKVLGGLLPKNWYYDWQQMERYGILILIFLLIPFGGFSIVGSILRPILNSILKLILPS